MKQTSISALLAGAVGTLACTLPTDPLPSTITQPFRVQVQNNTQPQIHNLFMNLFEAGGGDQHLFVGPVGVPTYDLTLVNGAITHGPIRANIGGEFSEIDETTKMFMTERADPRAIFQPTYACNPDTDELQIELRFVTYEFNPPGGWICVRPSFSNSHEFRYYPPGNDKVDPNRTCIKVTLVAILTDGSIPTTFSTSTTTSRTSTSTSTPTTTSTTTTRTTTTTSPTGTSTGTPVPYTDMTSEGFRFIGCAPEERRVEDNPGRTLSGALLADDAMTNERCMEFCGGLGYTYAGTEWQRECWCGNSYQPTRQPGTTWASLSGCNMRCLGDTTQFCGGDAWLSLYEACEPESPCVNAVFT